MLRRDKPREDPNTARFDTKVVESAAKTTPTVFDDAHSTAFGTILRCGLFQADDAVSNRVHRLVIQVGREIVKQENSCIGLSKKVLQAQDLTTVAQRALSEQPDLGKAIEHYPLRFRALKGLEDTLRRLPELKVGGI